TTAATSTTSTTAATSTTVTTAATSTTVNGGRCISEQLTIARAQTSASAGSVAISFTLTNTAPTTCVLKGYPGLQMLDQNGASITTHVTWGSSVSVPQEPVNSITLASGQQAYFIIGYASQTGYGSDTCPTSTSIEVTPPNDYHYLTTPLQISPYGGTVQNLQCGDITASPILSSLPPGY
ncbi:MAG: DUF4232 domain-containing protein, partial [Acidimicrobiales bacterium]